MRIEGLCIRNIEIGMGMPQICIPVVKQTADEILEYIGQIGMNISGMQRQHNGCWNRLDNWLERLFYCLRSALPMRAEN